MSNTVDSLIAAKIAPNRQSDVGRLLKRATCSSGLLGSYSDEELVVAYQIANRYRDTKQNCTVLCNEIKTFLLSKFQNAITVISNKYFGMFPDIGTRGEFFSEAYLGFERALSSYRVEKSVQAENQSSVMGWFKREVSLAIRSFVNERGGAMSVHKRQLKFRRYFNGGYDDDPEKKLLFEKTWGLDTEEGRAAGYIRYNAILSITPKSLDSTGYMSSGINYVHETIQSDARKMGHVEMENRAIINDFSSMCDPDDYEIFTLVCQKGYTQTEAAEILNIEKNMVLNALRRIKRKVIEYLKIIRNAERLISSSGSRKKGRLIVNVGSKDTAYVSLDSHNDNEDIGDKVTNDSLIDGQLGISDMSDNGDNSDNSVTINFSNTVDSGVNMCLDDNPQIDGDNLENTNLCRR